MAQLWSSKTPDKTALLDGGRGPDVRRRALAAHPSVQSVAVVGAPDQKWGQRVVAFVVPYPDTAVDPSDLVSHCRGLIAGYKVPKEIHLMGALPQTASGKVQKAALRKQLEGMS
jgi:acyl-CoA synthetase (AMP-forming)/AMP-acid ligase II